MTKHSICKAKRIGYFCWQQKTSINVRPFCLRHSPKSCALDSSDMDGEDLPIQFYDETIDL